MSVSRPRMGATVRVVCGDCEEDFPDVGVTAPVSAWSG